ncbi:MAG: InlB B-repeat-containing protein [Lachnospiraceae bacterium]|nr:InlB B-repeat-containing protein [Lachnospiraceae bacterium]
MNEIIYHYLEWENEYLIENYYLSVPDTCVVFSSTAPENVSVTFELMDGTPVDTVEIPFGTPVERPANPVKEGWIFDGWYVDGALTVRHDFSRPIGKDTTLFGGWVQAAEDMFPDPVFRAYVLEHFDENDDGMLSHIECNLVTHIDLFNEEDWSAGLGITSLQGIEYFVNLEWLQTISNPLTSIDVSQNHNLDLLSVSNAQLESLDVSNNTELTYLQFNNNNISSIDLSSNSKLIHLGCGGNPLVSLDLSHNTELKEIDALCYDLPMLDLSSNPYMERTYEEGTLSYMDEDMVYIPVYSLNEDSLSTSLCTSYRTVIKTSNSPESCNVTFYVNNGTDAQTTAVPFATAVSEPAVPENGAMEFTGWYEDEGLTRLYDFTRLVGKDINLYAGWQEVFTPVVIADAFPDPFFRAYVSEHFDLADEQGVKDGQLSKEEAEAVFDIDLNNYDNMLQGYGITTLQGIEYFPNLVSLQVNSNPITELNVSMNPHLVSLYCGNCQLNSLDLHNNAELIALECSNNNLSALDLSNNPMLYSLYCSGNQLTELDLSHNNSLMWLETCFNEIPILDISSNEYLTKAFTEGTLCYISGDEDYHNAPRYQYDFVTDEGYVQNWLIGISYTTVVKTNYSPESCSVTFYPENGSEASTETVSFATAVSEPTVPVNGEMEFTGWWYDDNGLTKLFDFTRLVGTDINLYAGWREYLAPVTIAEAFPDDTFRDYVCNNFDSDGDGILSSDERAAVKNIVLYDFVYSEGMGITSLQGIEYFPNLEYLNCSSNNLTSLDIGQNLKLVALECGYNQLTELDVSQNLLLQRLLCDGNQLTSIDVRANTDLEALYLSGNQLTSLDVSRNTLLKELYVGQNNLETLNLENNTLLLYLGCESCELVTLDVSNNKQLCNLNCGGNRLTYLDLSENTELVSLSCFNVNMAYLDIRENTYLKRALSSGEQSYGGSNLEGNILELVYHYLEIDDEYYLIANDYLSFPDTCIIYTENVPETCTVTFDSQGGSAVETVTVPFATAINRPADPTYEGEDFIGWFMDDKLTVPYNFDNPVGCDITLYAGWRIPLKPIEEMFPDSTFRSYLLEEYDGNQDGTLDYDELGSVTNLYVTAMGIESLKGIEYLSNLGELYCSFNLFTELDVSKNSFLWGLFCDHNEITELDVSKNLQLVMLSCEGCLLTDLDVSANLNLYQLNCNENQLTSLNLGNNTTIVYLNCAQNQLNSLNISNNPALVAVACAYNNLGYLDISGNLNLITAYEQGQKWEDSGYVSYEFAFTDVNQQEYNYFLSLSSDTTVITIRPDSCTITFDFGNGTTDDEVIPFGTTVSVPPVPTKEGWIFDGYWYYDAELTKPYDFMRLVGADTTLYAGWVEETIADAFPDPIFRNYVLQNIDSNQDGILSNGERKAVYELEVQALGISSLQGVECFENLTSLYCVQNNLTELNISGNPCLQFLSCGDNQISVLDISGNPLLLTAVKKGEFTDWGDGYLNYAYENLDEFGIYMEQYYLYFSQDTLVKTDEDPDTCTMTFETNGGSTVDAITVAFGATVAKPDSDPSKGEMVFDGWYTDSALTIPYDFSTRLTANVLLYAGWREYVEPTCTMTFNTNGGSAIAAKTVPFGTAVAKPNPDPSKSKMVFDGWFEDSALTIPYDFTTGLTKSITVYARWTEATTPAKDLFPDANFRAFLLENYDISKDGAFSQTELDAIDNLYISGKEIKSLQGIENLKNLKVLFCNDNQLTSIDVSKNLSLTNLDCSKNCLTTLNISNNQSLIGLECGDNQLTSLVVRPLIHLEWLGCENNQLSTLDLSQNTELSGLYCYGNRLTELDIRRNPKLSQLDCSNNQLSLLDVSACPKLWLLICHRNKLTTLDVSNLRSMDYLLECETYRNGPRVVYEYIDDDPAQPYPVYSYEGNGDGIRTDCGVTLVTAPFKTYIVTFKTNGGSEIAPVTVDYNKPVSKPADPTNGSHVFEGWFTSASCTTAYDFSKPVTGDITIYAKWRIESGQEAAKINSAALAFDGKLRLKFSYTIPDSVLKDKDAYVLFEKDGKEIARQLVSDGQIENGRHVFILDIAAQEYSDKVVVSLHDGKGNKITVTTASGEDKTDGMVYSAQTYAENKQETGSTPEMRNLAKALEDYGSATQIYFDHGDQTGLAVSGDVKSISLDELDPYAPVITGEKPEGLDKASISVAFDADNSMRIRYSFQKGVDPKKYTYTIDGVKTEIGEENGNYYLYVRNIAAPDLGKAHTFTISDGSKTYSITCSALTYARTSVQNGNEQRQDLGKALYLYNLAAKLYFDEE